MAEHGGSILALATSHADVLGMIGCTDLSLSSVPVLRAVGPVDFPPTLFGNACKSDSQAVT